MTDDRANFRRQLQRQSTWLKESLLWIVDTKMAKGREPSTGMTSALDVGCGPGFVMEIMKQRMDVEGVDIDIESTEYAKVKGLRASVAAGESLPFEDNSFDLAYCTFLLLWVKDPHRIVSEMKRVSRRWVACLAEPDYGGRITFPDSVRQLDELVVEGVSRAGGDPFIGRKLSSIFSRCGMTPEMGIHPGVWNVERLRAESDDEWRWIRMTANPTTSGLDLLRRRWDNALDDGSLFQFNPVFYAVAGK